MLKRYMQLVFMSFSGIDSRIVSFTSTKRTLAILSLQVSVRREKNSSEGFIPVCKGFNMNLGGKEGGHKFR